MPLEDALDTKKIVPPYRVEGYEATDSFSNDDEADLKVLDQLVGMGSDLNKERHSIHYLYFASEADALAAAKELEAMNFHVEVGEFLPEEPLSRSWPVSADRTEVINMAVVKALRKP